MKIVALFKLVPDLVEELEIAKSGNALDMSWLRLIINEFDNHAIEQAILLKERYSGHVVIITLEAEGADDMLFTAAAKGADQLIKLVGEVSDNANNHALARAITNLIKGLQPDLILTGVQAHNDLDGAVGPLLAEYLGMPYIGYVSGIEVSGEKSIVRKEYPGGLIGEMEVTLPVVLGIQAAEKPPRYVAVSKVRQMMKTATIQEQEIAGLDGSGAVSVERMFQPESGKHATMIKGNTDAVASRLVEIFKEMGVL
jgi:electron transfer flavoprotein beta subunit